MVAIICFHLLIVILAIGVLARLIPQNLVESTLGYLHGTVGITVPPVQQARTFALVWIGVALVIVDGCLALLFFITKLLK